ncbi:MAG TPA: PepSY-associated TM helix domain-containing protein [Chthoniobacter sp.]|nr:PepSY-associated TM helix domain-containing protein [Chthoniobacter sp.]
MRKAIFWLHLLVGIVAGCVILSMAISGLLIAWQRQIIDFTERGFRVLPQSASAALSPETLLASAAALNPEIPLVGLTLRSDPERPATVTYGRDGVILLNPYTGEILGEGASQVRGFFRWVITWHRWFATEGASKETGKAVTGACSLGFLGLVLSGFYLWWPRRWSSHVLKAIAVPSFALRGKSRDFNWHNAVGLWCAPLLLLITATGVVMAYPWANDLLYRMTGNEPPPTRKEGGEGGRVSSAARGGSDISSRHRADGEAKGVAWSGLDPLWRVATLRVADWKILSVRFGPGPANQMTFMIDRGDGGRPDLRSMLTLNAKTGEVVRWEPFTSYNAGKRLRMWARFTHTGEAGGWLGQALATLAAAGAVVLIVTGFALAGRRVVSFARRNQTPAVQPSDTANLPPTHALDTE